MTIPGHRLAPTIALAGITALGWLGACSDTTGPGADPLPQGVIVSDPVPTTVVTGTGAALVLVGSAGEGDSVAYVSLPPGTVPAGAWAFISRAGDVGSIVTAVRNGGFDPVPVAAQADDFIDIRVTTDSGAPLLALRVAAVRTRPPIVVRTYPPRRKTDVPVNAALVIVFSEPVAGGTLRPSSIQLFRGTSAVAGTVRLLEGSGTVAAFIPAAPLDPNTEHRLVVTQAVRDLEGDALEAGVTVEFTTGQSFTGPAASIALSPDTVRMSGATYQMTVTVRDAAGNELIDQPVTWATSDPNGLTVSPTGRLASQAAGSYDLSATVNGLSAFSKVFVLAGPAASLELTPPQATVGAAGDTVILTAIVRDATGRLLDRPAVTWTSSDLAVATATPLSAGSFGVALGLVRGVSPGGVTITATSGTGSDMALVTVVPPQPVASVTVTPATATLAVRTTRQLSATLQDANGKVLAGRQVTWTTDNAAVTTVDANGLVTGVGAGTTLVIATSEGLSDTAAITVTVLTFQSLSAGAYHTCGVTIGGEAFCWGNNGDGQLGDGSTGFSTTPLPVVGGLRFTALSAAGRGFHTCGLTTSGAAYCWGYNGAGQLGDGSTTSSSVPVAVAGGLTFAALSASDIQTCGITASGAAYCWGWNSDGQLGNGSTTPSAVPVAVVGGLAFSAVTVGAYHTCGLTTTGAAYCWGYGGDGQLGNGSTSSSLVPVAVIGGHTFSTVSANGLHTCGITTGGVAYCWGLGRAGRLGDGTSTDRPAPAAVSGGLAFAAVGAGGVHTCGATTSGPAYCWGLGSDGQLGDGSTSDSSVPVAVTGGLNFSAVTAGYYHSCGLTTIGTVYCWGYNVVGQLGNGTTLSSNVPVKVEGQP